MVNGVLQAPMEGTSMLYAFNDKDAPERHDLQYFEMFGNRGIYFKGWSAVTRHSTPWLPHEVPPALDDDVWELYDGSRDFTQRHDLAAELPDRLEALKRLWLIEAVKYNVLPIDDRRFERLNPTIAGRPQLVTGTSQALFPGMKRLSEHSVLDVKNRSFTVTAALSTATVGPTRGVLIAQGGRFGGWALYVKDGRAKFVYNVLGIHEFVAEATEEIPPGDHQVRVEFAYDGGGLGKGGDVTLRYDGQAVGTGRVDLTQPIVFSADETTDIGDDYGMAVTTDYVGASRFNGRIDVVQLDVGTDDHSHLIDPVDIARVAISRQ
jgi:arylsulfatase